MGIDLHFWKLGPFTLHIITRVYIHRAICTDAICMPLCTQLDLLECAGLEVLELCTLMQHDPTAFYLIILLLVLIRHLISVVARLLCTRLRNQH